MTYNEIISAAGFTCEPNGKGSCRVTVPFTYGDGTIPHFYMTQPSPDRYFITDGGENLFTAGSLGINVTASRIQLLNDTYSVEHAHIDNAGSIVAEGDIIDVTDGIWDAVKLIMALVFKTEEWKTRYQEKRFGSKVLESATAQMGRERIRPRAKVKGASGNDIQFPFALIREDGRMVFVSTLAKDNERYDWHTIYQIFGRNCDLKAVSGDNTGNRLSIIEMIADKKEQGKAADFLLNSSNVHIYNEKINWQKMAA